MGWPLKSQEVESKLAHWDKALAEAKRKHKDSRFHLAEAKGGRKNAKAALGGFEKQAKELQVSLKNTKMQLASAKKQLTLLHKDIEGKDAEKAKAKQAAYNAGMTKTG